MSTNLRKAQKHMQRAHELLEFGLDSKSPMKIKTPLNRDMQYEFGGILNSWRWPWEESEEKKKEKAAQQMAGNPKDLYKGMKKALREQDVVMVEQLLNAGAKCDEGDLEYAVLQKNLKLAKLLRDRGSKITSRMLSLAVYHGKPEIVDFLLEEGETGNLNGRLEELFLAARWGLVSMRKPTFESAELILAKGGEFSSEELNAAFKITLDYMNESRLDTQLQIHLIESFLKKGATYTSDYLDSLRSKEGIEPYASILKLMTNHYPNQHLKHKRSLSTISKVESDALPIAKVQKVGY